MVLFLFQQTRHQGDTLHFKQIQQDQFALIWPSKCLYSVCVCVQYLLSAGFNIWHRNSLGHLVFTHFPSLAQRRNSFQNSRFCSCFKSHQLIVWEPESSQCLRAEVRKLISLNVEMFWKGRLRLLLCTIVWTCWFFFKFDFKIKPQPKFGSLCFFFWADEDKKKKKTIFWMRRVLS